MRCATIEGTATIVGIGITAIIGTGITTGAGTTIIDTTGITAGITNTCTLRTGRICPEPLGRLSTGKSLGMAEPSGQWLNLNSTEPEAMAQGELP